jgi:hypothetical protein
MRKLLVLVLIAVIIQTQAYAISSLHTEGRYIKNETGDIVILRGMNRGQFHSEPTGAWGGWYTYDKDDVITELESMQKWGVNAIRLTTAMEYWMKDASHRQYIKEIIEEAGKKGIYVIYAPWNICDFGGNADTNKLPFPPYLQESCAQQLITSEQDFIDFWVNVSSELKGYSNVLYDIYNEPNGDQDVQDAWYRVWQNVITAIRNNGDDNIILVQWGYGTWVNLDFPPPENPAGTMDWISENPFSGTNLLYSTHVYRGGGGLGQLSGSNAYLYDDVKRAFQYEKIDWVVNTLNKPLIIGEIGANRWYTGDELQREIEGLNNSYRIFNEWGISYLQWEWWTIGRAWSTISDSVWYNSDCTPNEMGDVFVSNSGNTPVVSPSYSTNITGIITNSSGLPIQGTTITCNAYTATTNSTGGYKISMNSIGSCNMTANKSGYTTEFTTFNFPSNGTYVQDFSLDKVVTPNSVSGSLKNSNNQAVQATITVYQGSNVIATGQTDSNGNYDLSIEPGVYDVKFSFSNLFIPNYYIKILSVNLSSDVANIMKQVTEYPSENKVKFLIDFNNSQKIEVYSPSTPSRILKNNSAISVVPSLSNLANNTWFFGQNKLSLLINRIFSITAASGTAADIQAAVDQADAAGGGTVFIPAGNFTFIVSQSKACLNNRPCGVQIPGDVNLIGAGNNQTILYCPTTGWDSTADRQERMIVGDGRNNKPIRISGILFQGSVVMEPGSVEHSLTAIEMLGVKDFRIDHSTFIDFSGSAIGTTNNYVLNPSGNRGVIDHCVIDNPYKDDFYDRTGNFPYWAYGIVVGGGYPSIPWDPDWTHFFGKYRHDITYIEDCSISRCRHAVAGGSLSYGYYVLRGSVLTDMIVAGYGSYQDVHGGGQGAECYNNTVINTPYDHRSISNPNYWGKYAGIGFYSRGGFALYYNNTIMNIQNGAGITLANDQSMWDFAKLNGVWVWNNNFVNVDTQVSTAPNAYPIREGIEYFLRAPNQAQDGFTYTPYPYPHPLAVE